MKIRKKTEELTYSEIVLFQQYFGQIIYEMDVTDFSVLKQKIFDSLNKADIAQAILHLQNFETNMHVQEFGTDAWIMCFAILIKKDEPITDSEKLKEIYEKNAKKLSEKEVKETVVNFTKAFPLLYLNYRRRVERLDTLTELFLSKN